MLFRCMIVLFDTRLGLLLTLMIRLSSWARRTRFLGLVSGCTLGLCGRIRWWLVLCWVRRRRLWSRILWVKMMLVWLLTMIDRLWMVKLTVPVRVRLLRLLFCRLSFVLLWLRLRLIMRIRLLLLILLLFVLRIRRRRLVSVRCGVMFRLCL